MCGKCRAPLIQGAAVVMVQKQGASGSAFLACDVGMGNARAPFSTYLEEENHSDPGYFGLAGCGLGTADYR